jgi:hypothetical protein
MDYYDDEETYGFENEEFDWEADKAKMDRDEEVGEYDFNDDEKMYDDEEQLRNERNVFERVGIAGELIGMFLDDEIRTRDPLVLFRRQVRAISLSIKEKFDNALSQQDINKMLTKAEKLPHVYFKNSTAYVLGYIASSAGDKVNLKEVDYVFKNILPLFDNVKKQDVIRYAKYWLTL